MNYSVTKTKQWLVNLKWKLLKNLWIDEFIALKSKAYSFKCGDENTNKVKGISIFFPKNFKFEEHEKT